MTQRAACISCGAPCIDGGGIHPSSTKSEPICVECVNRAQGKMGRMHVYVAINEERDYQDKKHGDEKHSVSEWLSIMGSYADKANEAFAKGGDRCLETMLDNMRKIVASGVACMEQNGVVSRSDEQPKCDVCGDTEAEHKTEQGYDHAFGGIESIPAATPNPINVLVDAFLSWPLPESVRSDLCATMTPQQFPHPRSGTNLMTANEAHQMFEHVLSKLPAETPIMQSDFRKDIENTINRYSKENGSNTPDFIVAQYLVDCLGAYDKAVTAREKWYGRELHGVVPGQVVKDRKSADPDCDPPVPSPNPVGKPFLSSI